MIYKSFSTEKLSILRVQCMSWESWLGLNLENWLEIWITVYLSTWAFISHREINRNEEESIVEVASAPWDAAMDTSELSLLWNGKAGCQIKIITTITTTKDDINKCVWWLQWDPAFGHCPCLVGSQLRRIKWQFPCCALDRQFPGTGPFQWIGLVVFFCTTCVPCSSTNIHPSPHQPHFFSCLINF